MLLAKQFSKISKKGHIPEEEGIEDLYYNTLFFMVSEGMKGVYNYAQLKKYFWVILLNQSLQPQNKPVRKKEAVVKHP